MGLLYSTTPTRASSSTTNRIPRGQPGSSSVPPSLLAALPQVQSLTLSNLDGHSPAGLSILAKASPHLVYLSLAGGTWAIDLADYVPSSPSSPCSFERELLTVLSSFGNLEHLNLGILPLTKQDEPLPHLTSYCRTRGIELKWQGLEG
ncbi:hypothetical protein JCM8547_004088 [Rhodosporidiobolus lusitaniae]